MKSRDTNPSVAVREVTPELSEEEPDTGRQGHVPIAVAEGDFSTPSQRTRTITRPRGLKTLEQPVSVPSQPAEPEGSSLPAEVAPPPEAPRYEASVVDEFLAAPPTPEPEFQGTPAPDVLDTPSELFAFSDSLTNDSADDSLSNDGVGGGLFASPVNAIENIGAAEHLRQSALGEASVEVRGSQPSRTLPADDPEVFRAPTAVDPETKEVDDLLDQVTAEILATAPSPEEITETSRGEAPLAASATELPEGGLTPAAEQVDLSPLAQTLANMAESMHGEVSLDPTIDLDITDGPLIPMTSEASAEAAPQPISRPTPPPIPTGVPAAVDGTPPEGHGAGRMGGASLARLPEALAERPRRPKRAKPWFEEVFDESYLRTLPFMTAEQTLQEVDFIESSLGVPRGSEILDVACGYGRHAIELVQRGLSVTGIDLSLPLLIRAADESQRRAVSVNFVHSDMREMSFERQFSGAYCMLTSFGYFDEESNLKVAEGIARALKPGGRFLIDVINRDYVVGDLPARVWWEGDGCVVLEEVDFNFNTNRILTHRSVVFEDGQQLEQEISVRVYSLHELGKLLRQAGFRVIEVSGSIPTRGHFFGAHSRNLLILAERRAE